MEYGETPVQTTQNTENHVQERLKTVVDKSLAVYNVEEDRSDVTDSKILRVHVRKRGILAVENANFSLARFAREEWFEFKGQYMFLGTGARGKSKFEGS